MANYETTVQIPPLDMGITGIHTITIESLKIKKVNGNSVFNPSDSSTFFKLPWVITSRNLPSGWALGSIVQNAGPNNIHYQLPLHYFGNPSFEVSQTGHILLTQSESNNTLRINFNQGPTNPLVRLGLESNPNVPMNQTLIFYNKTQDFNSIFPIWNHLNEFVYWDRLNNRLEVHGNFYTSYNHIGIITKVVLQANSTTRPFEDQDAVVKTIGNISFYYQDILKLTFNNTYNFVFNFEPKVGGVFTSIYAADGNTNQNHRIGVSYDNNYGIPMGVCFKVKNQDPEYRRAFEIKSDNTWYSYEQLVNITSGPDDIYIENDWVCILTSDNNPIQISYNSLFKYTFRIDTQQSNDFSDLEVFIAGYIVADGQKKIQGIYPSMRYKIQDMFDVKAETVPSSELLSSNTENQLIYKFTKGNTAVTPGMDINFNYFSFTSTQECRPISIQIITD